MDYVYLHIDHVCCFFFGYAAITLSTLVQGRNSERILRKERWFRSDLKLLLSNPAAAF